MLKEKSQKLVEETLWTQHRKENNEKDKQFKVEFDCNCYCWKHDNHKLKCEIVVT